MGSTAPSTKNEQLGLPGAEDGGGKVGLVGAAGSVADGILGYFIPQGTG